MRGRRTNRSNQGFSQPTLRESSQEDRQGDLDQAKANHDNDGMEINHFGQVPKILVGNIFVVSTDSMLGFNHEANEYSHSAKLGWGYTD